MMARRYPGSYWAVPAFLEYVNAPLTDAMVVAAEKQLGVKLAPAYLEMLREQNGGYLRASWPKCVSNTLFGIGDTFASITRDAAWWRPKRRSPEMWAPAGLDLLIPFDGDGHWDMCFDYRVVGARGEPSITYVDCESEYEEPIAASFEAYVEGLVDHEAETAIRLRGPIHSIEVAERLATHFGSEPPLTDTWSQGHVLSRVVLPGNRQWSWTSPNRVPAGFRRDGKATTVTKESALRLPEDPDCSALVQVTDESREAVVEALQKLGFAMATTRSSTRDR